MITTEPRKVAEPPAGTDPLTGAADFSRDHADEVSLLELFLPLVEQRRLIATWALALAVISLAVAFLLPNEYTGTTKILPPQQAQSSASAMLGQLGALAGLAGKDLGLKNTADLYIGILKSRSIADNVIQQFGLQDYYHGKTVSDTRKKLEKDSEFDLGKDGLISIKYVSKDPTQAAKIANAYVQQLYEANQRLAISEASQRRLFFAKELEAEKNLLADAEVDLKKTQESTGLIQLSSQADAIIRAIAQLQAQLAAKEVQLQSMRSFATPENPEVIRTEQEMGALKIQLSKLERDNKLGGGNIEVPTGKIPEAGLRYVRKLREVKYHESLFEILAKQFEAAKIDEGKNAPIIQVVDMAIPPDRKSGPPRSLIFIISTILGFLIGSFHAWARHSWRAMARDPRQYSRLQAIRHSFNGGK